MKHATLVAALFAVGGTLARADEIVLTNGHTIKNARRLDSKDATKVVFEVAAGRIEVDAKTVSSVNPGPTPLHEFEAKYAPLKDSKNTAELWKLAAWAKDNKLSGKASMLAEQVLKVDPMHEAAHLQLGHQKIDGGWCSYEQAMEKKGFVLVDDRWMTRAEIQLIEKRRLEAKERELAQQRERDRLKREEKERRERDAAAYGEWMNRQLDGLDGYFYQPSEFWPAYFRPYPWAAYTRSRRWYQYGMGGAYYGGAGTFDLFRFMPTPFAK